VFAARAASTTLKSALILARETADRRLRASVPFAWLKRLELRELPFADALDAAESRGRRDFLLQIYELVMRWHGPMSNNNLAASQFPHARLDNTHLRCVLAGY
jgi:hypothetical protein